MPLERWPSCDGELRRCAGMGRVAVVTGGASGMGLAICRRLIQRGHPVAILDLNAEGAAKAAEDLRSAGAQAMAQAVDVSEHSAVEEAFAEVRAALGPVQILVTSAATTRWEPFGEVSLEGWDRVLAVNLNGTFYCIRMAVPDMVAAGWGRIVTFSSSGFEMGTALNAHYLASKGGVIGLTRGVAREYASRGITANTIVPHIIDTPMMQAGRTAYAELVKRGAITGGAPAGGDHGIPVGRLGTGDDVAAACMFLCSEESSYFTGQLVGVNGGAVMS
jgi:2-hydroxycyclohexanecarboxyl-CoA dehydrogenase